MWWLGVLGVFSALALLFTGQVRLDFMEAGQRLSWMQAFAISGVNWLLWALLTPIVIWFGRRLPITSRAWWRVAIHLPICLILLIAKQLLANRVVDAAVGMRHYPAPLLTLYVSFFTYFTILGVDVAIRQARARRERDVRTSQLEAELARAQLDALRIQLQPHFLFNALNSISALMREDVEAADVMLTRLAGLLRATLDRSDAQESRLEDEMAFVNEYIEIQRVRFGDRLTVRMEVAADTLALAVPTLVLQPLVENACRHGVGLKPGAATLAIRSSRQGERLAIEVEDDGPGPPSFVPAGTGLENTRARLRHLYGPAASLTLERAAAGGAIARLLLPAHAITAAVSTAAS
jgi:two-component sensor histidine kinase